MYDISSFYLDKFICHLICPLRAVIAANEVCGKQHVIPHIIIVLNSISFISSNNLEVI